MQIQKLYNEIGRLEKKVVATLGRDNTVKALRAKYSKVALPDSYRCLGKFRALIRSSETKLVTYRKY